MQVGSEVRGHAVLSKKVHPLDFSGFFEGLEQTTPILLLALGQGFGCPQDYRHFASSLHSAPQCELILFLRISSFVSEHYSLKTFLISYAVISSCLDEICPGLV